MSERENAEAESGNMEKPKRIVYRKCNTISLKKNDVQRVVDALRERLTRLAPGIQVDDKAVIMYGLNYALREIELASEKANCMVSK